MNHRPIVILTAATLLLIFSAVSLTTVSAWAGEQDTESISTDESNEKTKSLGSKVGPIIYLTIFVLAVFVGFEIITKIPPTLHTPLMSGSNAISGITIVGALLVAGEGTVLTKVIGTLAVAIATVNVVGGFMVTHRMLSMFRKKG